MRKYPLLILFFFLSCTAKDNSTKTEEKKNLGFLLAISTYRESGNCLRTESKESTTSNFCSRLPIGLCNPNLELYTEGEKRKRLSDLSKIIDTVPACKNLLGISGLLTESVTTNEEKDKLLTEKTWAGIEACESSGFSEPLLFPKEEALFLLSDRGKFGIVVENYRNQRPSPFLVASIIQEAQDCLDGVFTAQEKEILSQNRLGKKQVWVKN